MAVGNLSRSPEGTRSLWEVRLFGQFHAQYGLEPPIRKFRSRTAASVLAYLALHLERAIPREELCEAIWPDHDPELSRSSLRTAVFSLKKQFAELAGSNLIDSDRTHVWLDSETVRTDYGEFMRAFSGFEVGRDSQQGAENCHRALSAVRGPLLQGHEELWATPHQIAFEEMYSQCVVWMMQHHESLGRFEEAHALGKTALTMAPFREDIHVALIGSLNRGGKGSEAIRQFEVLERILDEQWGEAPSQLAVQALESGPADVVARRTEPESVTVVASHAVASVQDSPQRPLAVQLPVLARRVFGREDEIAELVHELSPEDSIDRLWTVTGPGGCGKTVLSICAATELRSVYNDRVAFVDLSGIRHHSLVITRIAEALAVPEPGLPDADKRVVELLSQGPHLLILDNAEHLIPEVSDIVDNLLEQCPDLHMLVTSRRLLGLEMERAFPVGTLESPTPDHDLATVGKNASVMLYVDRAKAIRHDFALTPSNAPAVIELCRRLDGLPLAIELAAAQTSVMSPSQVLVRYGDHSLKLRNKLRDASERHKSLETVLDWSYGLLGDEEQKTLRAVSVFPASFTLDAVQAVAGLGDAIEALETMLASSLVVGLETADGLRFRLLGPIQSYAQIKAEEHGEDPELKERFLKYFLDLAESRHLDFQGKNVGEAAQVVEAEHENFREAVEWAIATRSHGAEACWITGYLRFFVTMRGHFVEWSKRIGAVLDFVNPEESPLAAGFGHNVAGLFAFYSSQGADAIRHFEKAAELFEIDGEMMNVAAAYNNLGMTLSREEDREQAAKVLEKGLAAATRGTKDGLWSFDLLNIGIRGNLTTLYRYQGRYQEATELVTDAMKRAEAVQATRLIPPILLELAQIHQCLEEPVEALQLAERAMQVSESCMISANVTDALIVKAWCYVHQNEADKALALALEALPWAITAQAANPTAEGFAVCSLLVKDETLARDCLVQALGLWPRLFERLAPWQGRALSQAAEHLGVEPSPRAEPVGTPDELMKRLAASVQVPSQGVPQV